MPNDTESRQLTPFGRWLSLALASRPDRLTWKEVAVRAGVSYSYLIQIKNGHEVPSRDVIARLETVLQSPFGLNSAGNAPSADPPGGFHLVPVLEDPRINTLLAGAGHYLPVAGAADPGRTRFFLVASDNGLAPAIPPGAFCLTNPAAPEPAGIGQIWALSARQGPVIVRYLSVLNGVLLLQTLTERQADPGRQPVGRWTEPGQVQLWGRVEEVRYRLE